MECPSILRRTEKQHEPEGFVLQDNLHSSLQLWSQVVESDGEYCDLWYKQLKWASTFVAIIATTSFKSINIFYFILYLINHRVALEEKQRLLTGRLFFWISLYSLVLVTVHTHTKVLRESQCEQISTVLPQTLWQIHFMFFCSSSDSLWKVSAFNATVTDNLRDQTRLWSFPFRALLPSCSFSPSVSESGWCMLQGASAQQQCKALLLLAGGWTPGPGSSVLRLWLQVEA